MALRFDYPSGEMYDDGEPDTTIAPEELIFQMSPPARTFVDPFQEGYSSDPNLDYSSLLPTSQPLPQGSGDIDKDLAEWAKIGQPTGLGKIWDNLKKMGGKAADFAGTPQGMIALLLALRAAQEAKGPSGGGTKMGMMAPRQYNRTVDPKGIVRYAAEGGLMHAYAHGGEAQAYAGGKPLMMEDGGFVFTEKATRKLGPQGIAALGGKMISAPGNGTNDKGVTGIIGKHGVTPARVSNKESYFPKEVVDANGGPKRMYAAMNKLQGKA